MPIIDGKKFACASCIKGHRSSGCKHADRPLFEIKRKGRPTSQCTKCRELRKSKGMHSRCVCEDRPEEPIARPTGPNSKGTHDVQAASYASAMLALQRGAAEGAVYLEPSAADSPVASSSTGSCCSSKRKASSPSFDFDDIKPMLPPIFPSGFEAELTLPLPAREYAVAPVLPSELPEFAHLAGTEPSEKAKSDFDSWLAGQMITHDRLRASQHCASTSHSHQPTNTIPQHPSHPESNILSSLGLGPLDFDLGDIFMPTSLLPAPPPVPALQPSGLHLCACCGPACSCGPNCSCGMVSALEQSLRQEGGDDVWQRLLANVDDELGPQSTSKPCHEPANSPLAEFGATTTLPSELTSTLPPELSTTLSPELATTLPAELAATLRPELSMTLPPFNAATPPELAAPSTF